MALQLLDAQGTPLYPPQGSPQNTSLSQQQRGQAQLGSPPQEVNQNGSQSAEVSGGDKLLTEEVDTRGPPQSTAVDQKRQAQQGPVNKVRSKFFNKNPQQGQAQLGSPPQEVNQNGSQSAGVSGGDKLLTEEVETRGPPQSTAVDQKRQAQQGPVDKVRGKFFNKNPQQEQAQLGSPPQEVNQNGSQSAGVSGGDKLLTEEVDTRGPPQSTAVDQKRQAQQGPVNKVRGKFFNKNPQQGQAEQGSPPQEVHQNESQSVEVSGGDKPLTEEVDTRGPPQSTAVDQKRQAQQGPAVNKVRSKFFNKNPQQGQAQLGSPPQEVNQNGSQSVEVSGGDKLLTEEVDTRGPPQSTAVDQKRQAQQGPVNKVRGKFFNKNPQQGQAQLGSPPQEVNQNGSQSAEVSGGDKLLTEEVDTRGPPQSTAVDQKRQAQQGPVNKVRGKFFNKNPQQGQAQLGSPPQEVNQNGSQSAGVSGGDKLLTEEVDTRGPPQSTAVDQKRQAQQGPVNKVRGKFFNKNPQQGQAQLGSPPQEVNQNGSQSAGVSGGDKLLTEEVDTRGPPQSTAVDQKRQAQQGPVNKVRGKFFNKNPQQGQAQLGSPPQEVNQNGSQSAGVSGGDKLLTEEVDTRGPPQSTAVDQKRQAQQGPVNKVRGKFFNKNPQQGQAQLGSPPQEVNQNGSQSAGVSGGDKLLTEEVDTRGPPQSTAVDQKRQAQQGPVNKVRGKFFNKNPQQGQAQLGSPPQEVNQNGSQSAGVSGGDKLLTEEVDTRGPPQSTAVDQKRQAQQGPVNKVRGKFFNKNPQQGQAQLGSPPQEVNQNGSQSAGVSGGDKLLTEEVDTRGPPQSTAVDQKRQAQQGPVNKVRGKFFNKNPQQGQAQLGSPPQEVNQNGSQSAGVSGGDKLLTEEVDTRGPPQSTAVDQKRQAQQGPVDKVRGKFFNKNPQQGLQHTQQGQAQQDSKGQSPLHHDTSLSAGDDRKRQTSQDAKLY